MSNVPTTNRDGGYAKPIKIKRTASPPPGATNRGGKLKITGRDPRRKGR